MEEERLRVELDNKKAMEKEKKRRVSTANLADSLVKIFVVFVGFDKAKSGRTHPEPRREREDKTARVRDGKNEGKGKEKSCHKGSCSLQKKSKLCSVKIVHVTYCASKCINHTLMHIFWYIISL